jgi:DNA (cytosine-5)-methyltransferase 1
LTLFGIAEKIMQKKIQVIDLFCGAGGLSCGFSQRANASTYKIIAAADIDPSSTATYHKNLGVKPFVIDLGAVAKSATNIRNFREKIAVDSSAPLVIVGGPPCQGFSAHSKKNRNSSDIRNELVVAFAKIATSFSPDVIVFENVPEAMTEKNWPHFSAMLETFRKAGYFLSAEVHNLASFGVPQERFRTLVIASKVQISMPTPTHQPAMYRTVRDAIGSLRPIEPVSETVTTQCINAPDTGKPRLKQSARFLPTEEIDRPEWVRRAWTRWTDIVMSTVDLHGTGPL